MAENSEDAPWLRLSIEDGVAWIAIENRLRVNALNADMWASLPQLLSQAQENANVRAVVLRGAGDKAFSAGADISEFATARTGAAADDYNRLNHEAFLALEQCAIPTIAMIHGFCLGGGLGLGLGLAVSCDLRFCDAHAQFAIPAVRLGIGYHPRWVRQILNCVSPPQAKELLFTGRRFDSAWALRAGLVNEVIEKDDLEAHVRTLSLQISSNAPLSVRVAKASVDTLSANAGDVDTRMLEAQVTACFSSEDYKEGQRAFLEKRKPVFSGR